MSHHKFDRNLQSKAYYILVDVLEAISKLSIHNNIHRHSVVHKNQSLFRNQLISLDYLIKLFEDIGFFPEQIEAQISLVKFLDPVIEKSLKTLLFDGKS